MEECERALDHAKERRLQRGAAALELKAQLRELLEDFAQTRAEISRKFLEAENAAFASTRDQCKQLPEFAAQGPKSVPAITPPARPQVEHHGQVWASKSNGPPVTAGAACGDVMFGTGQRLERQARPEADNAAGQGRGDSKVLAESASPVAAEKRQHDVEASRHAPVVCASSLGMREQTQSLLEEVLACSRASKIHGDRHLITNPHVGLGSGVAHEQPDGMQLVDLTDHVGTKQLPEHIEAPTGSRRVQSQIGLSASSPEPAATAATRTSPCSSPKHSLQPSVVPAVQRESSPSVKVFASIKAMPSPTPAASSTPPRTTPNKAAARAAASPLPMPIAWQARYVATNRGTSPAPARAQVGQMSNPGEAPPSQASSPLSRSRSSLPTGPAVCLPRPFTLMGSDVQWRSPAALQRSGSPTHPSASRSPRQATSPKVVRLRSESSLNTRAVRPFTPPRIVSEQANIAVFPRTGLGVTTPTRLRSKTPPLSESQKFLPRAISPQSRSSSSSAWRGGAAELTGSPRIAKTLTSSNSWLHKQGPSPPPRLVRAELSTGSPIRSREDIQVAQQKNGVAVALTFLKELRAVQQCMAKAEKEVPLSVAYSSRSSGNLHTMEKLGPTEVAGVGLVDGATSLARLLLPRLPSSVASKTERARRLI